MNRKTLCSLIVLTLTCGMAFAQQGKIASGPYKGPLGPMMMAPDAPAAVLYSNLTTDPCTGFKYSIDNGFLLIGPSNCGIPGSTQWLAAPFISKATQAVTKVSLAVTNWGICTPTSNKFTVQIYDDNCSGVPNLPLGTPVTATSPAAPPALANANFGATGPLLAAGNKYWVVVTTSAASSQTGTTSVWWQATTSLEPYNLNDGFGWNAGPLGGPGGFQVQ